MKSKKQVLEESDEPLHAFSMIHLRRMPLPLLPYPDRAIPTPAHKLETRGTPVASHHSRDMGLVYLAGGGEVPDIECVEIVVF